MKTPRKRPDTESDTKSPANSGRETAPLSLGPSDIPRAAEFLRDGGLVAFPTETVYGLGADARQGAAVAAIFAAKSRPRFNPLISHVANARAARELVAWERRAEILADVFWPGPLTLALPALPGNGLSRLATAGLRTVAIRAPAHAVAQELLAEFGGPIAAPSANRSGRLSPTRAEHVFAGLAGQCRPDEGGSEGVGKGRSERSGTSGNEYACPERLRAVIDGGPCPVGLESTIVGLRDPASKPVLLRAGGLSREDIESALGEPLGAPDAKRGIVAPGMLESHYAPNVPLRLGAETADEGESHLGFGPVKGDLSLSPRGDLVEAASNLFEMLHRLDEIGAPIAVAPIPEVGLGLAINDRLVRAAVREAVREADSAPI